MLASIQGPDCTSVEVCDKAPDDFKIACTRKPNAFLFCFTLAQNLVSHQGQAGEWFPAFQGLMLVVEIKSNSDRLRWRAFSSQNFMLERVFN